MATPALPIAIPSAATTSASVKAALPALTVMMINGAINLVEAGVILAIGWTLSRWVWRWVHDGLARAQYIDATLKPMIANFASYAILAVTAVAVLGQFGVQTTSLIALVGAAGLAVGLALQGTLSNVASGVMLLVLRPFRVAEKITAGDVTGIVREIGLFRTVLITDEGLYVSIPNSIIFSGTIVNKSRELVRRTSFTIDIDYAENVEKARTLILDALAPHVLKDPAPDVQIDALAGAQTVLSVQVWVKNDDFGGQQSKLRAMVREALLGGGINPPIAMAGFPQSHAGRKPEAPPAAVPLKD